MGRVFLFLNPNKEKLGLNKTAWKLLKKKGGIKAQTQAFVILSSYKKDLHLSLNPSLRTSWEGQLMNILDWGRGENSAQY